MKPRPYNLDDLSELKRLYRELRGYMRISLNDGTDFDGRRFALAALEKLCEMADEDTA